MNIVSCFFLAYGQYCCPDCEFTSPRKLNVWKHLKARHLPKFNQILKVQREQKKIKLDKIIKLNKIKIMRKKIKILVNNKYLTLH
jgi:hypothetical protein